MTDHRRRNTPAGYRSMKERAEGVYNSIWKHSKIVFPIFLILCVAITVVIALNAGRAKDVAAEEASADPVTVSGSDVSDPGIGVAVTNEEFKNNAYPEVNALIMDYYNAVTQGDVDKVLTLSNNVYETEKIRIREISKYIESYPSVEIYTKPGPIADSYLAYVNYQVKFAGYDNLAPGIQTFYICTAEDGTLYMNEGSVEEYITDYIKQINMQDDVVELFNKVAVEYNDLIVNDPNLGVFLQELNAQMDILVGEALANAEAEQQTEADSSGEAAGGENTPSDIPQEGVPQDTQQPQGPVQARASTTVNVRSSDSETADKLGKLSSGTEIEVLEARPNGWSKFMYEGKEAYVKTEYLEMTQSSADVEVIGTIKALDNVNIRSQANETASKLGIIYQGETLDLIEKQSDGWSKVIYEGQIGYVKSEYVE